MPKIGMVWASSFHLGMDLYVNTTDLADLHFVLFYEVAWIGICFAVRNVGLSILSSTTDSARVAPPGELCSANHRAADNIHTYRDDQ